MGSYGVVMQIYTHALHEECFQLLRHLKSALKPSACDNMCCSGVTAARNTCTLM